MKITPIYPTKNNILATAQILDITEDDRDFDLEANLQFINGNSAVDFDFSVYVWAGEENQHVDDEIRKIHEERAAVARLAEHVADFVEAYNKASDDALQRLASLSA